MCTTYFSEVGYVCYDCEKEFKEYLIAENIVVETDKDIMRELKKFMDTRKGEHLKGEKVSVDEFFGKGRI